MQPLIPTSTNIDLAQEFFKESHLNMRRHATDPDSFFTEHQALQPDPLYMGLRTLVHSGPIGALLHWIDGKLEAREDLVASQRRSAAPPIATSVDRPGSIEVNPRYEQSDRDIAA